LKKQKNYPKEEQNVVSYITWKEHGIIESKYYVIFPVENFEKERIIDQLSPSFGRKLIS